MRVEIVYAHAVRQERITLELEPGTTARAAALASGLLARRSGAGEGSGSTLALGLFGKRVAPDRVLAEGDRLEILRPLAADPNEARRNRARQRARRR